MPSGLLSVNGHNLFTEQQEEWLGEVMDKEIRSEFNVIDDPDNYLQKIADRLQAQLPPSKTHYRFVIRFSGVSILSVWRADTSTYIGE